MKPGTIVAGLSVVAWCAAACGGSSSNGQGAAAASPAPVEAGAPEAAAKPPERPFANTALEAQTMIQSQIDAQMKVLWRCVTDYRAKVGDPHKPVVVDIGIDQEGKLIGVTTGANAKRGDLDPALKDCMYGALHDAPFPRSHAGVITVRQTFTDQSIQSP
jgi:hypothetical protein